MVIYRRSKLKAATYFFTVTLKDRSSNILIQEIDLLKKSFQKVKAENPFQTLAYVILPDHIHAVWKLPENDNDYSTRWRKIKTYFSQSLIKTGAILNKNKFNEYDLWQRRFWEHTINNEKDLENHINYIHFNPVKHGLVSKVINWPYSSFHYYVEKGILSCNWGGVVTSNEDKMFGE